VIPEHLHVVAAAIRNQRDEFLVTRRAAHQHQGDRWEFPGGKVEPGEGREAALARELDEELGIVPHRARPLIQVAHAYSDKRVFLDVWLVEAFDGEPTPREGQPMRWVSAPALSSLHFPAANLPILRALALPERYLITPEPADLPRARFLADLERAVDAGFKLIQLRSKRMTETDLESLAGEALDRLVMSDVRLVLNAAPELAVRVGAHGVHLSSRALAQVSAARLETLRAETGPGFLVGASCHDAAELGRAAQLGADFAVLGPVAPTRSHPDATPMGWAQFETLVREVALPVFALGGLDAAAVHHAQWHGAQGVAAIRAFWPGELSA
jgi:8-oxo-dGTP diphosphatase